MKRGLRMRYRLIVWDFDGTLADTLALALATYNDLAARHGFRRVDDPSSLRGLSTRAFLSRHGISLLRLPLLIKEYLAATRNRMAGVRLFDGLPELLCDLKERGYRQGVLSSNSVENIRGCLCANGPGNSGTCFASETRRLSVQATRQRIVEATARGSRPRRRASNGSAPDRPGITRNPGLLCRERPRQRSWGVPRWRSSRAED
jgi:phosphoglycolate phosphatase